MRSRFRGLRQAARLFRAVAWVTLAIGILAGLLALAGILLAGPAVLPTSLLPARGTATGGVVVLVATLTVFLLLYGLAALIDVLLAVEAESGEMTRRLRGQGGDPRDD